MDQQRIDEQLRSAGVVLREVSFYALWGNALEAGLSLPHSLDYVGLVAPDLVLSCAPTIVDALEHDLNVGESLHPFHRVINPVALEAFAVHCLSREEREQRDNKFRKYLRDEDSSSPAPTSPSMEETIRLIGTSYSPEQTLCGSLASITRYLTEEANFQRFRALHGALEENDGNKILFYKRFIYLLESKVPFAQAFSASVNGDYPSSSHVDEVAAKMRGGLPFSEAVGHTDCFPEEVRGLFKSAKRNEVTEDDCRDSIVSSLRPFLVEKAYRAYLKGRETERK